MCDLLGIAFPGCCRSPVAVPTLCCLFSLQNLCTAPYDPSACLGGCAINYVSIGSGSSGCAVGHTLSFTVAFTSTVTCSQLGGSLLGIPAALATNVISYLRVSAGQVATLPAVCTDVSAVGGGHRRLPGTTTAVLSNIIVAGTVAQLTPNAEVAAEATLAQLPTATGGFVRSGAWSYAVQGVVLGPVYSVCPPSCRTCSNATNTACTSCAAPLVLSGGRCVTPGSVPLPTPTPVAKGSGGFKFNTIAAAVCIPIAVMLLFGCLALANNRRSATQRRRLSKHRGEVSVCALTYKAARRCCRRAKRRGKAHVRACCAAAGKAAVASSPCGGATAGRRPARSDDSESGQEDSPRKQVHIETSQPVVCIVPEPGVTSPAGKRRLREARAVHNNREASPMQRNLRVVDGPVVTSVCVSQHTVTVHGNAVRREANKRPGDKGWGRLARMDTITSGCVSVGPQLVDEEAEGEGEWCGPPLPTGSPPPQPSTPSRQRRLAAPSPRPVDGDAPTVRVRELAAEGKEAAAARGGRGGREGSARAQTGRRRAAGGSPRVPPAEASRGVFPPASHSPHSSSSESVRGSAELRRRDTSPPPWEHDSVVPPPSVKPPRSRRGVMEEGSGRSRSGVHSGVHPEHGRAGEDERERRRRTPVEPFAELVPVQISHPAGFRSPTHTLQTPAWHMQQQAHAPSPARGQGLVGSGDHVRCLISISVAGKLL